ncbi:MAG: flagellar hook-basal body complex protein [Lachnospiraceae bacterium]|nr:flagellar hook-basal body complex protein [Candidatus Colinaster equi]
MFKGLYTAYTGMINEQNRMDVLTNNLANSDTNGFKKEGATSQSFDSVLAIKIKDASENANLPKKIGIANLGVKIGENYTDYSQGSFKVTDNTYDVALSGTGFFNVEFTNKAGEKSTKYTRDGAFVVNTQGYLVTKDGDYVLGTKGRIKVDPNKKVDIDSQGNISQDGAFVATLKATDFEDYNYLEHYGENYYQPVEGAKTINADVTFNQGYLETSNVQVVQEMVEMISVSRQYESNQRLITTIDSTAQIASTQLGKV